MANTFGYSDNFNPNNPFWTTPTPASTPNYYDTQSTPDVGNFNPDNSFWNISGSGGSNNQPQQDYSLFGGSNPNYFSSSPSNAVSLQQMYAPTLPSTASGFGGTGLDPAISGVSPQSEEDKPWWKRLSMPSITQGQADVFKGLAGLYSAYQSNKQAAQLREAAQRQDPFGAQRPFYQQQLRQTYSNPNAYMSSPEAKLQQDALRQQLERMDAKAGRRSQYGARAVQLAQAQAKQLADYRNGLQQAAGSGIGPQGAGTLQSAAAQAELNAGGQLPAALSSIYNKQLPQYQATDARLKALEDAFAKKG